jgi:MarR family transcriptional regulator, organic hydroperoxide resistance regulator
MMTSIDIPFLLEQAQRRLSRDFDRVLGVEGASADQWRVLSMLVDEAGHTIGALAQRMDMNPPTMTKLIDRIVSAGHVQRLVDEQDNRRVLVFITDSGLELHGRLSKCAAKFHKGLALNISSHDSVHLEMMLNSLTISTPQKQKSNQ